MRHRRFATALLSLLSILTVVVVSGCSLRIPTDPAGTLENITGGTLRIGASLDPGLVDEQDGAPTGELASLLEEFAQRHDANIEWSIGSEESLITGLETGTVDVAIGGFTTNTPWADKAAVTRGYPTIPGANGREVVVLVPLGENALLSALETFLDEQVGP